MHKEKLAAKRGVILSRACWAIVGCVVLVVIVVVVVVSGVVLSVSVAVWCFWSELLIHRLAMVEQFTLRWNKFHSNVSAGFVALLEHEELVDVTLAAEGQLLRAHKLVLSLCSPYFKRLFAAHPHDHPVVILKDVTLAELRDILHFMYRGEVNICQQDLSSFLHTAELLQVRGLSEHPPDIPDLTELPELPLPDDSDPPEDELLPPPPRLNHSNRSKPAAKKRKIKEETIAEPAAQTRESYDSHSDSDIPPDNDPDSLNTVLGLIDGAKDPDDLKQKRAKNRKVGNYQCLLCHRLFTSRYNLKIHMRDKHYSVEDTLQCHICQKRMRNPSCLRVHLYHHRKQAANLSADLSTDITADISTIDIDQKPVIETTNFVTP
ncbi:uncharacterized protein LOC143916454 [Arctopsyche grandis]|uniref:uncharacterized protein LOC143916454 n=1 Tax=Arctopsyche grandis TaxID=121162 RepID=UPI00406D9F66